MHDTFRFPPGRGRGRPPGRGREATTVRPLADVAPVDTGVRGSTGPDPDLRSAIEGRARVEQAGSRGGFAELAGPNAADGSSELTDGKTAEAAETEDSQSGEWVD